MSKKVQSFNAEIKQLLDIVIHSLYSQKEIFIRELISNASDAIDKLKYESLTNAALVNDSVPLEIRLKPDASANTLQIIDSGIGMTPDEVTQYIGTIAKSGTKAFAQLNQEMKSKPELIGQFGVGFYSAFMVANKVILHTQKAGADIGTVWESNGDGTFTIETMPRPEGHGTTITLELKKFEETKQDDGSAEKPQDFTDSWTLKALVKKYSDFVAWPIKMNVEVKKETETTIEDQTLNSQKALWLRPASEVKPEEYNEFYQHITHDWQTPAKHVHFKAEGTTEFTSLIYFPAKKPFNYQMKEYEFGLSLYIKRVFIMENCKDLLPPYLRFVKGLVDSNDLSLNVSRELLQQDRLVTLIRKNIVSKIFATLKDWLVKDRKSYETFWLEFGTTLKEGIPTDVSQTEKLQDLLLFRSNFSTELITLDEYVSRMKPDQKEIYFIAGDRMEAIENSPYLEKLKEKKYEVIFLTDAVDEWLTQSLRQYKEKNIVSVTKENLDLDSEEEKKQKETIKKVQVERFGSLLEKMKSNLSESVKDVVISDRLTETPVCLVSGENDMSANMQKILSKMGESYGKEPKRILEINPNHLIFEAMTKATDDQVKNWSEILYNQALLAEGSSIQNPIRYSKLIADLMIQANKQ
ncbi:MAG: molecular chaperone HtpG [Pseudobdellovibrio sp.]